MTADGAADADEPQMCMQLARQQRESCSPNTITRADPPLIGHTQLPSHTSNCTCSVRASPVAAAFGVGVSPARALYAGDLGKHAQVVPLGVHGEVTLAFWRRGKFCQKLQKP